MQDREGGLLDDRMRTALADRAGAADSNSDWPVDSWRLLAEAGVLTWSIPREYGGQGLAPAELLRGYELLASACLTTAFILSQREAAVRRLLAQGNETLRARLLPAAAAGNLMMTVGLSQLTTSRQYGRASLVATPAGPDRYRLDGVIPWVTAADQADEIVVGATLADDRQLLALLPARLPGVTIEEPLALMALAGSRTTQIKCTDVVLDAERILAGPAPQIMAGSKGGVGGLETSCLALGLAGAAIEYLQREAAPRPDLADIAARFGQARLAMRGRLQQLVVGEPDNAGLMALRVDCTLLALRATQAALAVAKGTGFVLTHPVQRWARQALFFLVWSCPRPAAEGILARLLPQNDPE